MKFNNYADEEKYFLELKTNIIRCMKMRLEIIDEMCTTVENSIPHEYMPPKAIHMLDKCHKNESKLMSIIDESLKQHSTEMYNMLSWAEHNIKDKKTMNKIMSLFKVLEIYNEQSIIINRRLLMQQRYVNQQSKESFRDFIAAWKNESEINKKIIKEILVINANKEFFAKAFEVSKDALKRGIIGGVAGAMIGILDPEMSSLAGAQLLAMILIVGLFFQDAGFFQAKIEEHYERVFRKLKV